ncbi:alpha/beta fold hydrolase [Sneathiella sp.]|jgi:3-oxoadipate enol-lactonase|uniref:alpha/beta fold hydrolase n=1 Tax=Sneathiella sp. TaxID=1964365 RepID=UPI0039E68569
MSHTYQRGFFNLGDHSLFYKISGEGPKTILISGTNSDTRHKPNIFDVPGSEKFTILSFDNRGMGQSSSPQQAPDMHAYADDVARLMDHLGWEKAHIVGISFGGMIAQHFAVLHPEKVTRLVLCCTSSGGAGGSSYPLQELQELPANEYAQAFMKLLNLKHHDEWQRANPKEAEEIFAYHFQSASATLNDPVKKAAMKAQMKARSDHDIYDQLPQITCPTMVTCGQDDGITPVHNSEAIAKAIPGATLRVYEGGHLFMKETPIAWQEIFSFLNGTPNSKENHV